MRGFPYQWFSLSGFPSVVFPALVFITCTITVAFGSFATNSNTVLIQIRKKIITFLEGSESSTHYLGDKNRFDVSSKGPSSGIIYGVKNRRYVRKHARG